MIGNVYGLFFDQRILRSHWSRMYQKWKSEMLCSLLGMIKLLAQMDSLHTSSRDPGL